MRFEQAYMFHWVWIWILLIGAVIFFDWRYQTIIKKFAQAQLLSKLMPQKVYMLRWVSAISLLVVIFFMILALAQPQWGFRWDDVKLKGLDIVLVVDTSKSMLSPDVKPNRLERTKLAIRDLLGLLKGDRVGLIAFAGEAFLVCPLTSDYNGFLLSLNNLNTDVVSRPGTNIEDALKEAMNAYADTENKYKAIVLITDGENWEGDPMHVARQAQEQGIKIFSIGIGTQEGELIPVKNSFGQPEFMKDKEGNFVKTRLNEDLLQKIGSITEGAYIRSSGAEFGLDIIYNQYLSIWEKREFESKVRKQYYERFQWPLTLAFVLLLFDTMLLFNLNQFVKFLGRKNENNF